MNHFRSNLFVQSIAHHDVHLQVDISDNAFEIRAIERPKCNLMCCSFYIACIHRRDVVYNNPWNKKRISGHYIEPFPSLP
jgi:hypothetical protein